MDHALVLAGGAGTRFWPLSRRDRPKHLLPLLGPRSPLEETAARLEGLVPRSRIRVVTPPEHRERIAALLPGVGVLAEPELRDTAPAAAFGLAEILAVDADAAVLICPADHAISPAEEFRACAAAALERAGARRGIVLLGIRPTRPATGFGWFRRAGVAARARGRAVHAVARFHEKPDLATATAYQESGDWLWNSGIAACAAAPMLARLAPGVPPGSSPAAVHAAAPRTSLDRMVLERSADLEAIEATFDWDDLGSWPALARHLVRDARGNAALGAVALFDADACVVHADGHLVALVGVRDLVVVHTPDATLVCARERAEEVKNLVEKLRTDGRTDLL